MAIKRGIRPSIAEVGKIKIGFKGKPIKSKNGFEYQPPKKLDHFLITTTERGTDGNFIVDKKIMEKIGDNPKEIRIRLPFDSIDKNFYTQYQSYHGNKKVCSGDGETAERKGQITIEKGKLVQKGDDVKTVSCDPELCPIYQAGKCKLSGILRAFLVDAPNVGGFHIYRTHGYNSTVSILGALEYFHDNTNGILQGLPLKLVLLKKTTAEHGTIAYATIVVDGEELSGLRNLALKEAFSRKELGIDMKMIESNAEKAGVFIDHDLPEDIQQEFYPEEVNMKVAEPVEKGATPEEVKEDLADKEKKPAAQKAKSGDLF